MVPPLLTLLIEPLNALPVIDPITGTPAVPSNNVKPNTDPDPLTCFEDSLTTIFNDSRNQHGEPGTYVRYLVNGDNSDDNYNINDDDDDDDSYNGDGDGDNQRGKRKWITGVAKKDILLRLCTPDPKENGLFSQFLWNAGVQAAVLISCSKQASDFEKFDVKDQIVLELGAGAGLPGIMSVLNGAKEVVLSDFPAPEILQNIKHNVKLNVPLSLLPLVSVKGHCWGEFAFSDRDGNLLDDSYANKFTRIIVADCMWMSWQHENLCKSIVHFLDLTQGEVLAIAGFHTGRAKVAEFFDWCERYGLVGKLIERDIEGVEREWVGDRGTEDVVERKRWLTIGRFRMKERKKQGNE